MFTNQELEAKYLSRQPAQRTLAGAKYRSRVETISAILSTARTGARKTHIMLRNHINSVKATQLLLLLQRLGLVAEMQGSVESHIYVTTQRGFEFLTHYEKLLRYLKGEHDIVS